MSETKASRLLPGSGSVEQRIVRLERAIAPASRCETCRGSKHWWISQLVALAGDEPSALVVRGGRYACPECGGQSPITWQQILRRAVPPGEPVEVVTYH